MLLQATPYRDQQKRDRDDHEQKRDESVDRHNLVQNGKHGCGHQPDLQPESTQSAGPLAAQEPECGAAPQIC